MTYVAYVHARPNTDDASGIFYVGKGLVARAKSVVRRNPYHANVVAKYGAENILVGMLECSSEQTAFELEKGLIKCLRRMGIGLTNMTDGGEGTLGVVVSERSRKLRSDNGKKTWSNPVFRDRVSSTIRGVYREGSTARANVSAAVKKAFTDPAVKEKHQKAVSLSKTADVRKRTSETLKKQRSSVEYREIMSKRMKDVCDLLEDKDRLSRATKGTVWITDGVIGRRVDPNTPIPVGFWRGKPDKRKVNLGKPLARTPTFA